MANFDINSFLGQFKGGARAYLFYFMPNIYGSGVGDKATYLVKSTTVPNATFDEITASWQGFDLKYAGRKTFDTFSVTFNSDEKGDLYKAFLNWSNQIRDTESGVYLAPDTYWRDQTLQMLDYSGSPIVEYTMVNAWPSVVGGPSLDYAGSDFVQFEVTFTYNYFKVKDVNA